MLSRYADLPERRKRRALIFNALGMFINLRALGMKSVRAEDKMARVFEKERLVFKIGGFSTF